jgi:hypothetical protein
MSVVISLALVSVALSQTLEVSPARVMADESVAIRAKGLDPGGTAKGDAQSSIDSMRTLQ